MSNGEMYCQRCNGLMAETMYNGIAIYECLVCGETIISVETFLHSYGEQNLINALEIVLEDEHSDNVIKSLQYLIDKIKFALIDGKWEEIVNTSEESVTDLAIRLLDDEDSDMRKFAAEKLMWDYQETKVLKALVPALKKEKNKAVIEKIEEAIGFINQGLENVEDDDD